MENQEEKKEDNTFQKIEEENKRLEEAIKKREELLQRQEQFKSREKVAGQAEAGKPMKTEEDLDRERVEQQADRIYSSLYDLKKRRR